PTLTQVRRSVVMWTYATPSGMQTVYFRQGVASVSPQAKPSTGRETRIVTSAPNSTPGAGQGVCNEDVPGLVMVKADDTPVFVTAKFRPEPLATFYAGTVLSVVNSEGPWRLVRFGDSRWGSRVGYIHCSDLTAARSTK